MKNRTAESITVVELKAWIAHQREHAGNYPPENRKQQHHAEGQEDMLGYLEAYLDSDSSVLDLE